MPGKQKRLPLFAILALAVVASISAQTSEGGIAIESEWDGYSPTRYNKGDQTFSITLGTINPLFYLRANGEKVENLTALKGQDIYIPFEGSPIEEATSFLAGKEGLKWGEDLKPVYSPFDASVALLKQGKAKAVVLPEPFVSMVEGQPGLNVSLDLYKSWNEATGQTDGYPQVAAFVKRDWAEKHAEDLAAFNTALAEAVKLTEESPEEAVSLVKGKFKQPEKILLKAVSRMHYAVLAGEEMKKSVSGYYELIGKPLDDKYEDFYYIPAK